MVKSATIDELHITIQIPSSLPLKQAHEVRRTLAGDIFLFRVRRILRLALRTFPELKAVRASLSR